jgi:hypothetical protein
MPFDTAVINSHCEFNIVDTLELEELFEELLEELFEEPVEPGLFEHED